MTGKLNQTKDSEIAHSVVKTLSSVQKLWPCGFQLQVRKQGHPLIDRGVTCLCSCVWLVWQIFGASKPIPWPTFGVFPNNTPLTLSYSYLVYTNIRVAALENPNWVCVKLGKPLFWSVAFWCPSKPPPTHPRPPPPKKKQQKKQKHKPTTNPSLNKKNAPAQALMASDIQKKNLIRAPSGQ